MHAKGVGSPRRPPVEVGVGGLIACWHVGQWPSSGAWPVADWPRPEESTVGCRLGLAQERQAPGRLGSPGGVARRPEPWNIYIYIYMYSVYIYI